MKDEIKRDESGAVILKTVKDLLENNKYAYDGKTIEDIKKLAIAYVKEFQRERKEEMDWGMIALNHSAIGCRSESAWAITKFIEYFFDLKPKKSEVKNDNRI